MSQAQTVKQFTQSRKDVTWVTRRLNTWIHSHYTQGYNLIYMLGVGYAGPSCRIQSKGSGND